MAPPADRAPRTPVVIAALLVILAGAVLPAAALGPHPARPGEVISAILRLGERPVTPIDTILFHIRLPRVPAAIAVGALPKELKARLDEITREWRAVDAER